MTNSLTLRILTLCILLTGLLLAPVSYAHPHAWIDLRTSVVRDATGRIIAIEQEWLLDPLYSTVLVEDLGADPLATGDAPGPRVVARRVAHPVGEEERRAELQDVDDA